MALAISSESISIKLIFYIIFIIFVFFYLFVQIFQLIKIGKQYFKVFKNYIELFIICLSIGGLALYVERTYELNKLTELFKNQKSAEILNLQYISYCNQAFIMCMAFSTAFATLKLINLLIFYPQIRFFVRLMGKCFSSMRSFVVFFSIIWLAFAQIFYLSMNTNNHQFLSLVASMETCFQILLGKFEISQILISNPIIGSSIFFFYNWTFTFILVNLFITILGEHFNLVKTDALNEKSAESEFGEYLIQKINQKFKSIKSRFKNDVKTYDRSYEYNLAENDISLKIERIDRILSKIHYSTDSA